MYCRIGDLTVAIKGDSDLLAKHCLPYQIEACGDVDIDLTYSKEDILKYQEVFKDKRYFEYNYTMSRFTDEVFFDSFCFHASAIAVDGKAILFSADSGTGKSTHASLWKKYMTNHTIEPNNDDKPLIRFIDGKPYAYGTPWAGKHGIHTNTKAPVKALVFLSQAKENSIEKIASKDAFSMVLNKFLVVKTNNILRL